MDEKVLGCDVGSQGTMLSVFGADGSFVDREYVPYAVKLPRPGWAEQDPDFWTDALVHGARRLIDRFDGPPDAIQAISFGSQLDGQVPIGPSRRPLRPCLIWMDRRAGRQAEAVRERIEPTRFYELSGTNLDSSHGVFKLLWVRDNEPAHAAVATSFVTPGSYVAAFCSGELAVDPSNGSSLGLLDPRTREWSPELLEVVDVEAGLLPVVRPATDVLGPLLPEVAAATGLAGSTVVVLGCGDEMAATLGAGVWEEGEVCDVVGTAEPVCAASQAPRSDPTMLVECHPHADPESWLMENPGFVSGGNLRWFRDQLGAVERQQEASGNVDAYDLLCNGAGGVAPGSDGLIFLPCMQGAMAPEWNGAARGVFFGLSLAHTREHMLRALLEGSAYALRDVLEAMDASGVTPQRLTMVGGGARSAVWRQIKADVTGLPVRRPVDLETTAKGAAVLAAVGAGLYGGCADAAAAFSSFEERETEPNESVRERYDESYALYRRVYDASRPVFPDCQRPSRG